MMNAVRYLWIGLTIVVCMASPQTVKTPMPPKTGMGKKENPDLKFLQKYYGTGYGTQIYTNKEKQKFLNFAKIIDQALSAYQERGEHDLTSDSNFVINTAKAIGKIAGLAAWEFREEDTNYQFTQYINEKLYPIYMEIYERHFPNLYGLREEIKDPQQMYQSIVNDIKKVAGQNDQLKKQMVEPVKCGYSMAQSMSARGIKGMFWFVPNSDIIFPLIHLYFDSWQLAKYNHTETEVFSMHEQACGHGTGIRAFIYFFAPQLAKALKKKLSKA